MQISSERDPLPARETNMEQRWICQEGEAKGESRNSLIVLRKQAETARLEGHKSRLTWRCKARHIGTPRTQGAGRQWVGAKDLLAQSSS